jgi:hypothetical protein
VFGLEVILQFMQIDGFLLEGSPKPPDEDVVGIAASTIYDYLELGIVQSFDTKATSNPYQMLYASTSRVSRPRSNLFVLHLKNQYGLREKGVRTAIAEGICFANDLAFPTINCDHQNWPGCKGVTIDWIFPPVTFRFIHTADLHLDSPLVSLALRDPDLAAEVGVASRVVLTRLVDLYLAEQVDALLIAGDLWDGSQTSAKTPRF